MLERICARYVELLRQVREEEGTVQGAADRLGLTQPYATQLLSGDRKVGIEKVGEAVQRLRLRPQWFFDPEVTESYKDYVGEAEALPASLGRFLASPIGEDVTEDERNAMLALACHVGERFTEPQWYAILMTLRA